MKPLKIVLIVLLFCCLIAGFILTTCSKFFVSKKKYGDDGANKREIRLRLIGYVLFMAAFAFAMFQSLIK